MTRLNERLSRLENATPPGEQVVFFLPHNERGPAPAEPQTGAVRVYRLADQSREHAPAAPGRCDPTA